MDFYYVNLVHPLKQRKVLITIPTSCNDTLKAFFNDHQDVLNLLFIETEDALKNGFIISLDESKKELVSLNTIARSLFPQGITTRDLYVWPMEMVVYKFDNTV